MKLWLYHDCSNPDAELTSSNILLVLKDKDFEMQIGGYGMEAGYSGESWGKGGPALEFMDLGAFLLEHKEEFVEFANRRRDDFK